MKTETPNVQPQKTLGAGCSTSNVERRQHATFIWRSVAVIVGVVFLYAGAIKAWDPLRFADDIENYHVLPWSLAVRAAFFLPWLEITCGIALIIRRGYSGAVLLLLTLMLVFIGATLAARWRGIDISCGCFGHLSDHLSFAWHIVLDLTILAAVAALAIHQRIAETPL